MQKTWDILGIGTAAVDDLLTVERFPQPDEKMPIRARQRQGGGQVATGLVAAARHGARTAFLTRLGDDDDLSDYTIRELEREGVDCALVERAPGSRPVHSFVIVDSATGSRTILHDNQGLSEPERIDPAWIAAARVLFFDQNAPHAGLRAAQIARGLGVPVVADLERTDIPHLDQLIAHTDHLIVSAGFAARITAAHGMADAGGTAVAGGAEAAPGAADLTDLTAALARLHCRLRAALPPVAVGRSAVADASSGLAASSVTDTSTLADTNALKPTSTGVAASTVVVTCGACGCWYTETGYAKNGDRSNSSAPGSSSDVVHVHVVHVPAIPVQAVDTTGCGDVFHGAYAAAIARGEPVARAVLVANAAAGLKATQPGGRAGIPTLDVVERLLNAG